MTHLFCSLWGRTSMANVCRRSLSSSLRSAEPAPQNALGVSSTRPAEEPGQPRVTHNRRSQTWRGLTVVVNPLLFIAFLFKSLAW